MDKKVSSPHGLGRPLSSILLELASGIRLNKNAVRKRIQKSRGWLQWMAKRLLKAQGFGAQRPEWLKGKRVLLADATDMALQGSSESDYRLHYVLDLFDCACAQHELTTYEEGEKLTRFEVSSEDVFVVDRGYCNIQGMEHVRRQGGRFVIRFRNKAFVLYGESGERIELLEMLRGLKTWEARAYEVSYRLADGTLRPVRLVAVRKDEAAGEAARTKQERTARRLGQTYAKETQEMTQYIVVVTNLEETPERIAELYRARWQIEQLFRRLKGLFAFGEVPSKNPESVKAWFYGKLLVAALCEAIVKDIFPPTDKMHKKNGDPVDSQAMLTHRCLWRDLKVLYTFVRHALFTRRKSVRLTRILPLLPDRCRALLVLDCLP